MATVTEKVKESLVGTTQPPNLSQESRAEFMKHAKQDDDGDWYMTEGDFINAIAPPEEDYVRQARAELPIKEILMMSSRSTRSNESNTVSYSTSQIATMMAE